MHTTPTWHSGPPPHVGWWTASLNRSTDYKRYFDGHSWSKPVLQVIEPQNLLRPATSDPIEWTYT